MGTHATAHISEIPPAKNLPAGSPEPGEPDWKPVRHHFEIGAFGVNAWVARAEGDEVVESHTESSGHEELYYVANGHATFTVDGESIDAPAGTFVFVRDPTVHRVAVADKAGTTVLTVGGWAGRPFAVSEWERRYTG
jgi:mannose-6-phosphate isomerase-like protein (cupin superfamily)